MQVVKRQVAIQDDAGSQRLSALSMYSVPPPEQLSLTEFEEFAFDRLRCAPLLSSAAPLPLGSDSSSTRLHTPSNVPRPDLVLQCSARSR